MSEMTAKQMNTVEARLRSWAGNLTNGAYRRRVTEAADEIARLVAAEQAVETRWKAVVRKYVDNLVADGTGHIGTYIASDIIAEVARTEKE